MTPHLRAPDAQVRGKTAAGTAAVDLARAMEALAGQWREQAASLRRYGASQCADALTQAAAELNGALAEHDAQMLTLPQAAEASGYSTDHLGRLIREGKLHNAGREHAPRIRLADLPRKATALRPPASGANLDRAQIARSVVHAHQEQR